MLRSLCRRILILVLPLLLFTLPALAQNKPAVAAKGTSHEFVENEPNAETTGTTDEVDSSSSTSSKKSGVTHFELHPELAAGGKSKSSFELFPASKPARVPTLNGTANASQAQPQEPAAGGADDAAELSKKLSNPVSSLISFPIQSNFDFGMGSGSGWKMTMNIQPVIPVALNKEWNLISRTIIPIVHQSNVVAEGTSQSGLGDIVQSFFISPNKTEPFIWGVGPVVLIPTATNQFLGSKQLGLGPTVVVLKQQEGWTVGALWNHIWRVAGGSGRPRVNADFIQPFLAYSTKDGWTYNLNTESTYDWTGNSWSVPVHFTVSKIVRFGKQPISFGGALRCWVTSPTGGPEGCGPRIVVTGIFPKK